MCSYKEQASTNAGQICTFGDAWNVPMDDLWDFFKEDGLDGYVDTIIGETRCKYFDNYL